MATISKIQTLNKFMTLVREKERLEGKISTLASQLQGIIPGWTLTPANHAPLKRPGRPLLTLSGKPRKKPGPKPGFRKGIPKAKVKKASKTKAKNVKATNNPVTDK